MPRPGQFFRMRGSRVAMVLAPTQGLEGSCDYCKEKLGKKYPTANFPCKKDKVLKCCLPGSVKADRLSCCCVPGDTHVCPGTSWTYGNFIRNETKVLARNDKKCCLNRKD